MRDAARFAVLAALALPGVARASNEEHERTPVNWEGNGNCEMPPVQTPCMILHDRTAGPLHIPYAIPHEDTQVGPDESPQSRTHQFFGLCHGHRIDAPLPGWITGADVEASEMVGQLRPGAVAPDEIFELRADWDDCWFRINADADRRPITCAMAEEGVDWDTGSVPPGVYTIEGYTYEPVQNVWSPRPGVVKIHDGDPDAVGPAVAVTTGELLLHRNQVGMIEGCVDAPAGSTLVAYWAAYESDAEVEPPPWQVYGPGVPVEGDSFTLEFAPPEALFGKLATLRVDVEDPDGRTYSAFMLERLTIVNADGPCTEGGGFVGGSSCDDTGEDSGEGGSSTAAVDTTGAASGATSRGAETTAGEGGAATAGGDGCGCRTAGGGGTSGLVALVGLALVRPRRSR